MKYVPPQASDQGLKSQKPETKIDCCQFKLLPLLLVTSTENYIQIFTL